MQDSAVIGTRVRIGVSDPWEYHTYNNGETTIDGAIIDFTKRGWFILEFDHAVSYDGQQWSYGVPVTRYVGQPYFSLNSRSAPANISFFKSVEAAERHGVHVTDASELPNFTRVIGSVTILHADKTTDKQRRSDL